MLHQFYFGAPHPTFLSFVANFEGTQLSIARRYEPEISPNKSSRFDLQIFMVDMSGRAGRYISHISKVWCLKFSTLFVFSVTRSDIRKLFWYSVRFTYELKFWPRKNSQSPEPLSYRVLPPETRFLSLVSNRSKRDIGRFWELPFALLVGSIFLKYWKPRVHYKTEL